MNDEEKVAALQAELRERDKQDMLAVKQKLDLIMSQLAVMREEFASADDVRETNAKVSKLEGERMKLVGGFFVLQAVGAILMFIISKLWK